MSEGDDLDSVRPGWQPDPEREGYERWFDGTAFTGRAHREPDLANAARRIIGLLRDGRLGKICFDEQQLFGRRVSAADREAGDEVEQRYARARRSYRQDAAIRAFRRAT